MDKLTDGCIRGWQSVTNGDDLAPVLVPAGTIYAMTTEIITRRDADASALRDEKNARKPLWAQVKRVTEQSEEALAEVARLKAKWGDLRRGQEHAMARQREKIQRVTEERDKTRADLQFMVERACDEKLDGCRELADVAARADQVAAAPPAVPAAATDAVATTDWEHKQRLTFRFLTLSALDRYEIALKLELLREGDDALTPNTVFLKVFQRAVDTQRLGELWDETERRHYVALGLHKLEANDAE